MKKSIKRLSAILAILVLSMTIAVPVTAVEYEEDFEITPYATNPVYFSTLSYSENDVELIEGSFSSWYRDNSNNFYMSSTAMAREEATEFVGFGVGVWGIVEHSALHDPDSFDVSDDADDLYDSVGASYVAQFYNYTLTITACGSLFWGGEEVDYDLQVFESGVHFPRE